ncbi:MAG: hypothetical protein RLZ91_660 [Bacteroidota bacterium]
MSLVVVMNGPDATAGLIFNWFKTKGVTVPIKDASITTANKERDTVMDNMISPLSINMEQPKAKMAAMRALINATTNTF